MVPNNNNNAGFQIFEDSTATPSAPVPSNQNNQFVMQPAIAANNLPDHLGTGQRVREAAGFFQPIPKLVLHGQENLGVQQPVNNVFNTNGRRTQNAAPGANKNIGLLTPAQLHTAYNTSFVPAGAPATVATWNQGYSVEGNWHAGQLHNAVNQRLARPVPDCAFLDSSNAVTARCSISSRASNPCYNVAYACSRNDYACADFAGGPAEWHACQFGHPTGAYCVDLDGQTVGGIEDVWGYFLVCI